ncbi:hypothetical protein RF55_24572, partial [Lasius niger]
MGLTQGFMPSGDNIESYGLEVILNPGISCITSIFVQGFSYY